MTATKPIHSFFQPKQKKDQDNEFEMTLSELANAEKPKRKRRNKHDAGAAVAASDASSITSSSRGNNAVSESLDDRAQRTNTKLMVRKASTKTPNIVVVNDEGQRIVQKESSNAASTCSLNTSNPEQQPTAYAKQSILQQLRSRSTSGTKIRPQKSSKSVGSTDTTAWSPCPWLVLMASSATAMAFDPEGVLLAVATPLDKKVIIYDWDTVVASDFKGRMDLQKDVIQPMLQFRVPHTVSELQWDANDHLLVNYRGTPALHVYDMAILADDIVSSPRAAVTKLQPAAHVVKYQGPRCASFLLDSQHVVACYPCGSMCLWNVASSSLPSSLVWTYKVVEPVSCLLPISSNLLLLGGTEGGFVLLDWRKTKRAAFASDKTPTIVASWKTHALLAKQKLILPAERDLGVQTLSMDIPASSNKVDLIGSCRVTWVTAGGWCLSMDLGRRKRIQVHHLPPETKTLTSEGVAVPFASSLKRFSSPSLPILATSYGAGTTGLLWQAVAQTTHVLPHQDKRVCQQREVRRSNEMRLCWMDAAPKAVSYLPLRRHPTSLTVHPGKEWMIVATETKLGIYNTRPHHAWCSSSVVLQ